MKNIVYLIYFALFFIVGCEKAEIPTYEGKDYVQFFNQEDESYRKLAKVFSFRYSGSGVEVDTVFLDVIISGPRADYDRKVYWPCLMTLRFTVFIILCSFNLFSIRPMVSLVE